ncbi:hypothetical protein SASPL_101991 [Salvia splendens]|uniref:Uncharacterized protein n=1 Tax=Salvia splendens TaxID=180675 RepID=A0A8X9ACF0_SALSN|nr:hypothetical protein SASPL_101991 [Salvia splendens]
MESPYGYNNEQQGGYYEECYSPDGGSYYDPDCFDYSYDAHDYYANENFEMRAGMEEQSRSKWEELLEICIIEVQENRKMTNQRLINLERNTSLLEQGLASLAAQVRELEFNMGVLATAIWSKHNPGTLPSFLEINPNGKCHAVQLRSGTTYQPLQASDLGRGRKDREHEPTDLTPATDQPQRPAAHFHSGPPEAS